MNYCIDTHFHTKIKKEHLSSLLKRAFKQLIKECFIDELKFYKGKQKQIFLDIGKLVDLMKKNDFDIQEREYIKINNIITDYELYKERNFTFTTVQNFKKWIEKYIPNDIKDIDIKKEKDKYVIKSKHLISIPFKPTKIKGLDIKLERIDSEFHKWDKIYEITNFKEKNIRYLEKNYQI